jgi:hypothetical protein
MHPERSVVLGDRLLAFAPENRDRDFFVKRASFGFFIFSKKKREKASSSPHRTVLTLRMVGGGGEGALDQSQIQNRACAVL